MTLALLGLGGLDPHGAWGQPRWILIPTFSLAEVFDDNIFLTSDDRESDFITEFTPGLILQVEQPRLTLVAGYSITGQVYAKNSDLNNFDDNQSGFLSATYRASQRLTLGASGYYARTNRPTTFFRPAPVPEGVTVTTLPTVVEGNEVVHQATLNVLAGYQLDTSTSGTASYSFAGIGEDDTSHTVALGLARQLTALDRASVNGSAGLFDTDAGTQESFTLLLGWDRQWSPSLATDVGLGPQYTDGDWNAAANLGLRYQVRRGLSVSLRLTQGASLVVGTDEPELATTLTGTISYQATRALQLTGYGYVGRTAQLDDPGSTNVMNYAVGLNAGYQIRAWLGAYLRYEFTLEDGGADNVVNNRVTLGLAVYYPVGF